MRVKKFSEKINNYSEYEKSDYVAIVIHTEGGLIDRCILFDDLENLKNYIINYVNNFIAQKMKFDSEFILETIEEYPEFIMDNGIPKFFDSGSAIDWYNEFYQNRGLIEVIHCDKAKNVQLEDIVKMARDTKKYNL